jgi:hypothetical protein
MNANEFLRNCEVSELLKDIDRRGITEFVQSYIPRSDDAFLGSADLA